MKRNIKKVTECNLTGFKLSAVHVATLVALILFLESLVVFLLPDINKGRISSYGIILVIFLIVSAYYENAYRKEIVDGIQK